jgi:hypothetical protein
LVIESSILDPTKILVDPGSVDSGILDNAVDMLNHPSKYEASRLRCDRAISNRFEFLIELRVETELIVVEGTGPGVPSGGLRRWMSSCREISAAHFEVGADMPHRAIGWIERREMRE